MSKYDLNKNEINILLELLTTAIDGVEEDLNQERLSDQGATVLSKLHNDLYRIKLELSDHWGGRHEKK